MCLYQYYTGLHKASLPLGHACGRSCLQEGSQRLPPPLLFIWRREQGKTLLLGPKSAGN